MTDLGSTLSSPPPSSTNGDGRRGDGGLGRQIGRRRSLPGGRAVVGGFLVAVAAVGVFAAYTSATAGPATAYLVATRDLPIGALLAPGDVELVPMELPAAQRNRSFDDPFVLEGATTVAPLRADELVQQSSVVRTDAETGTRLVSFSVDATRALNGRIRPGERIDVLATYGDYTQYVLGDVTVVDTSAAGDDALGTTAAIGFVVDVGDRDAERALAHAAAAATLSVARTTGAPDEGPVDVEPYFPPGPDGAGDPADAPPVDAPPADAPPADAVPPGPADGEG